MSNVAELIVHCSSREDRTEDRIDLINNIVLLRIFITCFNNMFARERRTCERARQRDTRNY